MAKVLLVLVVANLVADRTILEVVVMQDRGG